MRYNFNVKNIDQVKVFRGIHMKNLFKIVLIFTWGVSFGNVYGMIADSAAVVSELSEQVQTPCFKQSVETEIEEAVAYFKKPDEMNENVKSDVLSNSKLLHHREDLFFLPDLYDWAASKNWQDLRDLQKTFDVLKNMMKIPDEVKIMYCFNQSLSPNALMSYNMTERIVYVYPAAMHCCRSYQLFTLIHELTHTQQHVRMGLMGSNLADNIEKEREADTQAAQAIKCPFCMQVIMAEQLLHEASCTAEKIASLASRGYLVAADLRHFQNLKIKQDSCELHKTNIDDDNNNTSLQSTELQELCDVDYNNGLLVDRLSTVKFD